MIGIFTNILTISMQATIVAVLVIMAKKVFASKINVRISYLLWIFVLVRLVFPVLPESPASIFNAADFNLESKITQLAPNSIVNQDNYVNDVDGVDSITGATVIAQQKPTTEMRSENPNSIELIAILSYIWAIAAILIAMYLFFVNMIFASRLKNMTTISLPKALVERLKIVAKVRRRSIRFVEGEDIKSPCVFGVINCTVLLPKGFSKNADEETISHILMHEFAHIKHSDLVINWLTSLICAMHWFNPVIWYVSKAIKRDQELCADAYAMSIMDEQGVSEYGHTLLSIVNQSKKQSKALITAGITEDKNALKQRIINIAAFSKNKYRLPLLGLVLIIIAGVFLCTSKMNYPKTGEERMKFDENIIMGFNFNNANDPKNFELQISNNNEIDIHSCELEIYDSDHNKPVGKPVYSNYNFRIKGQESKKFDLKDIDYNNAYLKFNFKVGFTLVKNSNKTWYSGDLRAYEKMNRAIDWSAVSDSEADAFIKENNINSIATNKIYDLYTIAIFENGDSSGYYELYKDNRSGELRSRRIIGFSDHSNKAPVQMMGGTASGNYPFVNFKINSPAILALGDKIEIQTSNGIITRYVAGIAAHTVETRGYGSVNKILIYDKNEKLIFDGEKSLQEDVSFMKTQRYILNP